ncbi:MAG: hypothetical protein EON53_15085 [Actinomycetales bacterium]|nr:MAG: hypothetical protein EON53_15085 [Actinomycetales bacterium]
MSGPRNVPHKKQLAVSRRVRVPGPDADWSALHGFAQTFDAAFFLSSSTATIVQIAYRPAFDAVERGEDLDGSLGIALLRAALWFQARSDTFSGATDFSGPEVERFYRAVCGELHSRTHGWVDDQT